MGNELSHTAAGQRNAARAHVATYRQALAGKATRIDKRLTDIGELVHALTVRANESAERGRTDYALLGELERIAQALAEIAGAK